MRGDNIRIALCVFQLITWSWPRLHRLRVWGNFWYAVVSLLLDYELASRCWKTGFTKSAIVVWLSMATVFIDAYYTLVWAEYSKNMKQMGTTLTS
jgi:hypothetical protein